MSSTKATRTSTSASASASPNSTAPPFKVIIIGAGFAGGLLANGLVKSGVSVSVHERQAVDSAREGFQITLSAPALAGFRACLTSGQLDALVGKFGRTAGGAGRAPVVYEHAHFRPLLDLTRLPNYSRSAPIYWRALRDALNEPLREAGVLEFGTSFSHYEIVRGDDRAAERVRVHFDDGRCQECDVLIAADGTHSRTNVQIGLNNIKQLTSHVGFMVKAELSTDALDKLPPAVLQKQALVFAENRTMYFSVFLPEGDSHADSKTAKNTKSDSGKPTVSCMLACSLPVEICPDDITERSSQDKLDLIAFSIRGWAKEWHQMVDFVRGSQVYCYKPRVSTQPAHNWRDKARADGRIESGHPRIWLMGDAVHAMLPNRGMGGNQSMLDAAKILPLLVDLAEKAKTGRDIGADVSEACRAYEAEMIPRTFEWVKKSGGENIVPIDSASIFGRLFFILAAQVINVAAAWFGLLEALGRRPKVDDAPEFK